MTPESSRPPEQYSYKTFDLYEEVGSPSLSDNGRSLQQGLMHVSAIIEHRQMVKKGALSTGWGVEPIPQRQIYLSEASSHLGLPDDPNFWGENVVYPLLRVLNPSGEDRAFMMDENSCPVLIIKYDSSLAEPEDSPLAAD